MSRWMSDPRLLDEQAAGYGELVARGDLAALAHAVMRAACRNGAMTGPGAGNLELLRSLPGSDRRALGRIWADWLAKVEDEGHHVFGEFGRGPGYLRAELLVVASGVVRDLDGELLAAERQSRLADLAGRHVTGSGNRDWELAAAELAAGRIPAPPVLAVFRRTALVQHAEPALLELLAAFPGPALNPGELWADRALKDQVLRDREFEEATPEDGASEGQVLKGRLEGQALRDRAFEGQVLKDRVREQGGPWSRLLSHSAPPTARVPSATWARAGRRLLEQAGPEQVRHHLHTWFGLVGLDRDVPLRGHRRDDIDAARRPDPYNCRALRALAWLLGLLPPDPGSAAVLARLTDTALRPLPSGRPAAPEVAEAAVVALALLDDEAAHDELADLARRVTHRVVARRISVARTPSGR